MSRNSSGTYSQPGGTAAVSGATIDPTSFNTLITDLGSELTNSLDRGGRGAMTAALNLGGFKGYNAADPTVSTDLATKNYVDTASVVGTRQIIAGTGLSGGGTLAADRTISLANTAVSAGSYAGATITVNAQGQVTAASANPVIPTQTGQSGKFLTTDGSNPSWASNTAYTQPTTVGTVGTYAFLNNQSGGTLASGATTAGSNLRYSDALSNISGTPSGTWQCMGYVLFGNPTLFLRIS